MSSSPFLKPRTVATKLMFTFVAGQSKPGATVGPVLAKNGINIMKFVKEFAAQTEDIKVGGIPRPSMVGVKDGAGGLKRKARPSC